MSYNGYTNEATYMVELLTSNEYKVYQAVHAIAREHEDDPRRAAPAIKSLVTRTLDGETGLLTEEQRQAWRQTIRRDGGLSKVNWQEIAEVQGRERRKKKSGWARTADRAARRAGKR